MATAPGRERDPLSERLFREPFAFDFFQAVRTLERMAQEWTRQHPRSPRFLVGQDQSPDQEVVRFRSQPSLSFPPCPIVGMRPLIENEDADATVGPLVEMVISFLGVTGPIGVLPSHYTSLLLQRIRDHDYSLRDFLDMFHHRAISVFYRSWVKYRLPFSYERSRLTAGGDDLVTWALYCLVGMGTKGQRGRLAIHDETFLYYAGHFAHFPRSAVSLQCLLADYFSVPVRVIQLQGQWLQMAAGDQAELPSQTRPQGLNNQLGLNLVVGERVWDIQCKVRLQVGPLTYPEFQRFMPSGTALKPLCQLARTYVGAEFDFDVQVILKAEEVPASQFGGKKARLGWNSWMRQRTLTLPAEDAVFGIETI